MTSTWKLIRILSSESEQNFEIKFEESKTYTCGRTKNKDIVCDIGKLISKVSKDHCIFFRDANKIYVQDLKSTNGTFLNGKKLSPLEVFEMKNNDVISLGTSQKTTEKNDVYIYCLKKEDIVIDLESEPESDLESDIEIISQSLARIQHETKSVDDRAVIKINLEFNVQGNNFSSFQINPISNAIQNLNESRISDEIEVITQRTETVFLENTHLQNPSTILPNAQNSEQTSRKAIFNRNYSENVQENKELPSVSTSTSENLFIPKNKPTIISEINIDYPKIDKMVSEFFQNKNQRKKGTPIRIISENQQNNRTLLDVDRECGSSKCANAIKNSKSMPKESKAQNTGEFFQHKEGHCNKVSDTVAIVNNKRFKSPDLSPQKSKEQDKQNGEENYFIPKFTEKKKPIKRKFEENIDQCKNKNSFKSSLTYTSDENPFTIGSSRDTEYENEQYKWTNSLKPICNGNSFRIERDKDKSSSVSQFEQNRYKNHREEVQRKRMKSSVAPRNLVKNTPNKDHNMLGLKFRSESDENPFTTGSSRDPNRKDVQYKGNNSFEVVPAPNPLRNEYRVEEKRIQREDVQKKCKKNSFTPVPSENPPSIAPNNEKTYKPRQTRLLISQNKNSEHKFRKNEQEKICNSSASSESINKHRFSDKEAPSRKKNDLRSVKMTEIDKMLEKVEKKTKMFKEKVLKEISLGEDDTVSHDENTLVQILKTLETINNFIKDINDDHKEISEEKSSSLISTSSLNDEFPVKKVRIKEKIRLVDYESSSSEGDTKDDNPVTSVSPISNLELYETDFKSDEILLDILSWNPVDFVAVDYSDCKACSENYNQFLYLTSKTYKDFESYCRTLLSFLLLEIACGIKSEFSALEKNPLFTKSVVLKDFAAEFCINKRNLYLLSFKIKFTCSESNVSRVPLVGDLISIEIIHGSNETFEMIFAYVSEVSIDAEGDPTLIMDDKDFQLSVTCTVVTKRLEFNIYNSRIKSLRVIVGILVALNLIEALEKLQNSALLPMILHPEPKTFSLSINSSNQSDVLRSFQYIELQKNLDCDQLNAVMKITNVIQSTEPKICLIEGPPGTGKTNIAINIILRILLMQENLEGENQRMKILVCAKSKSEIDEILIRLSTEEKRLGMYHKLVRVGNPDKVHERVKSLNLRELAISYTDVKKEDGELDPLNYLKNLNAMEKFILSNADVIFCTLSMCLSECMSSIFGEDNPIPICIVDEATQANEIDILQPLSFGVKQLILLGDECKSSIRNLFLEEKLNKRTHAENLKLSNSLFSRLRANFEESKESPVINLEAQYRMNKRVTFLINQFFSKEILENKQSEQKEFPIYSCSVFSLQSSNIPIFAGNIIFCILNFTQRDDFEGFEKPISIGVIVAQSSLKKRITAEIEQRMSTISMEKREQFTIDVDTIAGFKNQERHILIITCVKENPCLLLPSGEQWLYSAMSKVKYSLIMYGDKNTFEDTEKVCLWNSFIKYLKDKKNLLKIKDSADSKELLKKLLRRKTT